MSDVAIKIENIRKQYKLGAIGGTTLNAELQSWWAKRKGKENPNLMIGQESYDGRESFWALDGINLEIKKGEAVGIIGSNGAGKSTLLKLLSRVTAPTEGDIWIDGRISSMLEVGTGFHGELTGRENIYMNGAILGMSRKEVDEKIESIIDFSECRQFIDTPVKRYSSGMYVKLAFAVASHLDSEIIIMDEVLAVGDMKFQKKCLGKMGDAAENEGKTILYVSHNMTTIRNLCTRCIVLDKGRIVYDGDVETAIGIYMDYNTFQMDTHYCFDGQKRSISGRGDQIYIHEFDFLDVEQPCYASDQKMRFAISVEAKQDMDDICVRLEIRTIDQINVGMSESKALFSVKKGQNSRLEFGFDVSSLAEGLYTLRLTLFKPYEVGKFIGYDETTELIYFEVKESDKERCAWLPQYWGHIKLPSAELI